MEIKGFGSYTEIERRLARLTIDEKNELYLSGELDRMLDDVERESRGKNKRHKDKVLQIEGEEVEVETV